ncbi:MAG: DUF4249 family protein [Bacteroidota bacterium]
MRKFITNLFVAISLMAIGCTKIVDPGEIPHDRRLVIRGIMEVGKPVDEIYIGRTLALHEQFSPEKAAVEDAIASIESNGIVYPLRYRGVVVDSLSYPRYHYGLYAADSLSVQSGRQFRLSVQWNDLNAFATASTPPVPVIDSIQIIEGEVSAYSFMFIDFQTYFTAEAGIGYIADRGDYYGRYSDFSNGYDRIMPPTSKQERLTVSIGVERQGELKQDSLLIILVAMESALFEYILDGGFTSRHPDDYFVPNESLIPPWNVSGDGLGLFVARARAEKFVSYTRSKFYFESESQ